MEISISKEDSTPIYKQIEVVIKKKILNNELTYGIRLPSERGLADILHVHRNTVIKAYKMLVDEELISCDFQGRKGYYVVFNGNLAEPRADGDGRRAVFRYSRQLTASEKLFEDIYEVSFDEDNISFGGHILPDEFISLDAIKKVMESVISKHEKSAFSYCPSNGNPLLRKQLAQSLLGEGIHVKPGEVVIINDTTQGIEYLTNILAGEQAAVVSEAPIMPDTHNLFQKHGLRVFTVPLEEDGVNLTQLENIFRNYRPKFFHTMPDYHCITGARMSLEKRYALLDLANQYNVPIIEERWYSGMDYEDDVIPSLFALDRKKNVITLDNAISKFYYGAKLSYLIAPSEMAGRISRYVSGIQVHLQNLEQLMFVEYLKAGYNKIQRQSMVTYYREKRDKMNVELEKLRELGVQWNKPKGGFSYWLKLPAGIHDIHLYERLRKRKVIVCPGKLFYPYGTDEGCFMRLSFSNASDEDIEKGIKVIYDEIKKQRR